MAEKTLPERARCAPCGDTGRVILWAVRRPYEPVSAFRVILDPGRWYRGPAGSPTEVQDPALLYRILTPGADAYPGFVHVAATCPDCGDPGVLTVPAPPATALPSGLNGCDCGAVCHLCAGSNATERGRARAGYLFALAAIAAASIATAALWWVALAPVLP